MRTCAELQMAIDQQSRGALPVEEHEAVARHLLTCEACLRYSETARLAELHMAETAAEAEAGARWERVRGWRGQAWRKLWRDALWTVAITVAALTVLLWDRPALLAAGIAAAVVQVGILAAVGWRRLRAARVAERSDLELLAFVRQQVRREIREHRAVRAAALPLAAALVLLGLAADPDRSRLLMLVVAVAAFVSVEAGRIHFSTLPRLRRELSELEP